ncbi:LPD7 domain-containing protein [Variovorax saccharolyticus]|uniref:LPD7 domain-containing protein n=1 Tax=Variovorax saccharolyticus TaxID=3053516 RepID=UPI002574F0FA|nr:LPD7 domain-containing protein [Variovorax sp. J31P216]MDM0029135.1 hypothetical protein [Variovorax sp. J31P216]
MATTQSLETRNEPLIAIDARAERLEQMDKDSLSAKDARRQVKADALTIAKIDAPELRFHAAAAMALSADHQAAYKTALREQAPAIADEVDAARQESGRRTAEKEERKRFDSEVQGRAQTAREMRDRIAEEAIRAAQATAQEAGQEASQQARERVAALRNAQPPATNSVDLERRGRELQRAEMIMPRRIVQGYTEINGKFFANDSSRLMFEDKGEKLATSGISKELVADMVSLARAKQWESLKLTGSIEFRREAWLQAESQGIRTQGYTPKDVDLAALKVLTAERATNAITPLQDRKPQEADQSRGQRGFAEVAAPRHDLNKNQAVMHAEASKNVAANLQVLGKQPGLADHSTENLAKIAYWRGIVQEESKHRPQSVKEEALARFDRQAEDPQFVRRIDEQTRGSIDDRTIDRTSKRERDSAQEQARETPEQSL